MIITKGTEYDRDGICHTITYKSEKKPCTFILTYLNNGNFQCRFWKRQSSPMAKPIDFARIYKTMAEVKDWFEYMMQEEMKGV